jgi:hypothetical protein
VPGGADHEGAACRGHAPHSGQEYQAALPAAPELTLLHAHWGARWAFEPLGPYDPLKKALDRQIGQPFAHWTIYDLRHTARSLLSRITTADVAELCLGHTLKGVRRTYDHHSYMAEKKTGHGGPSGPSRQDRGGQRHSVGLAAQDGCFERPRKDTRQWLIEV